MTIQTPIIIFAFNRPDKLEKLIQRLSKTPYERAYIFCDGPRNESDYPLCIETQRVAKRFAQSHPVELVVRSKNYGLSKNLVEGISDVLSKHSQAIIFEDDIYPKEGCVAFLDLALLTFKDRHDIFSVGCYHRPISLEHYHGNVILSPRFNCWGWATWDSRWNKIKNAMAQGLLAFKYYDEVPSCAGADLPLFLRRHHFESQPITWDVQVAFHCLKNNWWQAQPRDCFITNDGFDGSGTHCGTALHGDSFAGTPLSDMYQYLDGSVKADVTILKALAHSYDKAGPPMPPFRRWRYKWRDRIRMALGY